MVSHRELSDEHGSVVGLSVPGSMDAFRVLLPLNSPACTYLARMTAEDGYGDYVIVRKLHQILTTDRPFMRTMRAVVAIDRGFQNRHVRVEEQSPGSVFLFDRYEEDLPLDLFRQLIWDTGIHIPQPIVMRLIVCILDQMIAAVRALHDTLGGVAALGINPDYLFIGLDGTFRLVGLPLAVALQRFPSYATSFRENLYASPERICGRGSDERGDVWAAGLIAWEMLAGRRAIPLNGGREALRRAAGDGVQAIHTVAPTTPASVAKVITRACSRNTKDRHQTLEGFRGSLLRTCDECSYLADPEQVAAFVKEVALPVFAQTKSRAAEIEQLIGELDDLSSWEEDEVTVSTTIISELTQPNENVRRGS